MKVGMSVTIYILTRLKFFRFLTDAGESEASEDPSKLDESVEKSTQLLNKLSAVHNPVRMMKSEQVFLICLLNKFYLFTGIDLLGVHLPSLDLRGEGRRAAK